MTVTLSKRIEEFAEEQVRAGRSATADEAVNRYMEEQLAADDRYYDEIEQSLLAAVKEPTIPYREGEFVEMVEKMIAEKQRA